MTPLEVAQRIFVGHFKIKGSEIIPDYCPFCKGGRSSDRETFAINVDTGLYNCKRSHCGAQGTLSQLCKHFGIDMGRYEYPLRLKKQYKKPTTQIQPADPESEIEKYLKLRGFRKETWEARGVGESEGRIVFPYYENGELVAVKFRGKRDDGKWKKFSMEAGGKLIFWGMDQCDAEMPLIIVEGEMDALALDEAGIPNAVSLPNGCKSLECVNTCWDWLQKFQSYYIWTDADEGGIQCQNELISRLGKAKCMVVTPPDEKCKDANDVLYLHGQDGIAECLSNAQAIPLNELKNLADLPEYDPGSDIVVPSSIMGVNNVMNGGYRMGEVSVWTGINSSGKSTMLGQEMLNAIDNGYNVCAYSGELRDHIFRYWIDLQAAGSDYITQDPGKNGRIITKVAAGMTKHIRDWYRDRFWLYDSRAVTQDGILEVFEYAYRRHDCKVFMIDNLMSLAFNSISDNDFYRKQANFVGRCKDFAIKYNVHIHIVAHPRKVKKGENMGKEDVGGSGDITNWADNVFEVHRFTQKQLEKFKDKVETKDLSITSSMNIMKNRMDGNQDVAVLLGFEKVSKRFFPAKDGSPKWTYGWVKAIGKEPTLESMQEWESLGKVVDIEKE